ncbi:MAG: hypothetical protein ACKPKO_17890, partial [Candidatus Fonsibacter sp.]
MDFWPVCSFRKPTHDLLAERSHAHIDKATPNSSQWAVSRVYCEAARHCWLVQRSRVACFANSEVGTAHGCARFVLLVFMAIIDCEAAGEKLSQ